jgi:hypothetical protein
MEVKRDRDRQQREEDLKQVRLEMDQMDKLVGRHVPIFSQTFV